MSVRDIAHVLVPGALSRPLIAAQTRRIVTDPTRFAPYQDAMRTLLAPTTTVSSDELAAAHVSLSHWRVAHRWHSRRICRQPVDGLDVLRDRPVGRGVVLNFAHHGWYEGVFASLHRHGFAIDIAIGDYAVARDPDPIVRRLVGFARAGGGTLLVAGRGQSDGIRSALARGRIVALSCDLPGRHDVHYLGRRVQVAGGPARLAVDTDSWVVPVTSRAGGDGRTRLQLHAPIVARDHADPASLLQVMFARHEAAVLAWPAALEAPAERWREPVAGGGGAEMVIDSRG